MGKQHRSGIGDYKRLHASYVHNHIAPMASTAACTAIGRCRRQTVAAEEQNVLPAGGETFQADGNDG